MLIRSSHQHNHQQISTAAINTEQFHGSQGLNTSDHKPDLRITPYESVLQWQNFSLKTSIIYFMLEGAPFIE